MAGTTRFVGPHCFSLANGGHGEEAAILAAYLADQGLLRVVVTGEGTEGDAEYRQFFREQAGLYGVEILDEHYFTEQPTTTSSTRCSPGFVTTRNPTRSSTAASGSTAQVSTRHSRASVGTRRRS